MEASYSILIAKNALQVLALVLAVSTLGSFISAKTRLPDVVVFLLLGLPLGP